MPQPRRHALLALLAVLLAIGVTELLDPPRAPPLDDFDQPFYLGIAHDLQAHGRFTNGWFFDRDHPEGQRPSAMRFGPLVPSLFAAAALVDPRFRSAIACQAATRGSPACGEAARLPRLLQLALVALGLWLTWPLARTLGLPPRRSALALGLVLLTTPMLLRMADYLMTETATYACTALFSLFLLAALNRTDRPRRSLALNRLGPAPNALLAGAALGLAALARPEFLYLVPFAALLAAVLPRRAAPASRLLLFVPVLAGAALATAPWIARNAIELGHAELSFGYAGHTLAQRVSFNHMTGRDLGISLACWFPDGSFLAARLAGPGACDRFGWTDPASFYLIGMRDLVPATLASAGGVANHLHWLIAHLVLPHLGWHALTTLALAWRGLWVDRYWSVVLAPFAFATLWRARHRRSRLERNALALALPPLFMLGFNAFVAVDQPRYNLFLIPALALCASAFLFRNRT